MAVIPAMPPKLILSTAWDGTITVEVPPDFITSQTRMNYRLPGSRQILFAMSSRHDKQGELCIAEIAVKKDSFFQTVLHGFYTGIRIDSYSKPIKQIGLDRARH
jgi:hypothetical protein